MFHFQNGLEIDLFVEKSLYFTTFYPNYFGLRFKIRKSGYTGLLFDYYFLTEHKHEKDNTKTSSDYPEMYLIFAISE